MMDDVTVAASNLSPKEQNAASAIPQAVKFTVPPSHSIADTGATSIFVMAGTPMTNVRTTAAPLSINLPNGGIVNSTHVCDIIIPGLPKILTGHIVPGLAMASF